MPTAGRRRSYVWYSAAVVLVVAVALLLLVGSGGPTPAWVPSVTVIAVGGLALVVAVKGGVDRRRYEEQLAAAAARDAVLRDRLAIAGDLHDIVSHGLGAISVRAAVAARLAADDPAEAVAALDDVTQLSRRATADVRRLLSVLRDADADAPREPAPSLADLPALLERASGQGLQVTITGADTEMDASTALVAYHVVREALHNTARHAGPTEVRVAIEAGPQAVRVQVIDRGLAAQWAAQPGAGHGLALLRTRVEAQGGSLCHGPRGDGYEVEAILPADGQSTEQAPKSVSRTGTGSAAPETFASTDG